MNESNYYKDILQAGKIGIIDWDLLSNKILISDLLYKLLGYENPHDDKNQFSPADLFPSSEVKRINEEIKKQQVNLCTELSITHKILQKDNTHRWFLHNGTLTYDRAGNVVRLLSTMTDISSINSSEKSLNEAIFNNTNIYHTYIANAPYGIFVVDSFGNYKEVNKAACDITGYSESELLTMNIKDILDPDNLDQSLNNFKTLVETGSMKVIETCITKDNIRYQKAINAVKINEDRFMGFAVDVTESVKNENLLKESEDKYKRITERSFDAIYIVNLDKIVEYISPSMELNFGHKSEDVIGTSVLNYIPESDIETTIAALDKIFTGEKLEDDNAHIVKSDGTIADLEVNVVPIYKDDVVVGAQGMIRDVTEKNIAIKKLKEAEEEYRNLFEFGPVSTWREDFSELKLYLDTIKLKNIKNYKKYFDDHPEEVMKCVSLIKFIDINNKTVLLHNARNKEEILNSPEKIFTADFAETFKQELIYLMEGNYNFSVESQVMTFDGKVKDVLVDVNIDTSIDDWSNAYVSIVDISERKKAELALLESQKLLDQILDRSNGVIYVKDLNHKYIYVNSTYLKLFNLNKEAIIGKTDYDLFSKEIADKFIENDNLAKNTRKHVRVHEEVLFNGKIKSYISDKFPLFNAEGELYATCGISTDISDLLEAQQKEKYVQQELVRKDRLINVGHLAAAVAHEINNPMTVLHGSLEELQSSTVEESKEIISDMLRVSKRIINTVKNLLIFTRQNEQEMQRVDVNTIITSTHLLMSSFLLKSSIEYSQDLTDESIKINVEPVQIQQVLINIIFNAVHAMNDGGKLHVSSFIKESSFIITITDNGIGIPEDTLKSIFLPFFTTKEVGKGTGLGLSISHGIIEEHGGTINVESEVNKGTTITISLPVK